MDRGKDLGTVVSDSITHKEVETFECGQRERVAYGDSGPLSPGGQQGGSKKEINEKMIYRKAQLQDTWCMACVALQMACVGSSVLYRQLTTKLQALSE